MATPNLTSDYIYYQQAIEGSRFADLRWGTSAAKSIVVAGNIQIRPSDNARDQPHLFCLAVRNGAQNRSYVAEVLRWNMAPEYNKKYNRRFVVSIPGDISGTWATGNTVGMYLAVCSFAGSALRTAPNTWTAGTFFNSTNMPLGTDPQVFGEYFTWGISNMGLYADPDDTGVAPEFETPMYEDALRDCQRYWYRAFGQRGLVTTATVIRAGSMHPVPMRVAPTLALVGTGLRAYDIAAASAVTAVANAASSTQHIDANFTRATGLTVGRRGTILVDSFDAQTGVNYVSVSARM